MVAIVISTRAFRVRTSQPTALTSGRGMWYRHPIMGVHQRSIVVGLLLGFAAIALSACGGGPSASTTQKAAQGQQAAQAQNAEQKAKAHDTVVGMHYTQMASSVDPITSQLHAELSTGRNLPDQQVKSLVAELDQFDAAVLRLSVPSGLRMTVDNLRTANERLVKDLTALEGAKTVTPAQEAAARGALQRQRVAASAMSSALGISTSTH